MAFARGISIWPVVLAGCVCLPGCGGSVGAPGAPERQDEVAVPGAPIRVPSIGGAGDRQLSEVEPELEKEIRDRCGAGLRCVGWEIEHVESGDFCGFKRLVPAPGQLIPRGTKIRVIAGRSSSRSCGVDESAPAESLVKSGQGTGETGDPSGRSPASTEDLSEPPQERGPSEDGVDEPPGQPPGERAPEPGRPPADEPP